MKRYIFLAYLFFPCFVHAEPCGGNFGIDDTIVAVSSDICQSEATELIRKLKTGDYTQAKNVELQEEDLEEITYIHTQKRDDYYRCYTNGYLVVSNILIEKDGHQWKDATSTAICIRKKKRGLHIIRIDRNVEGVLPALMP